MAAPDRPPRADRKPRGPDQALAASRCRRQDSGRSRQRRQRRRLAGRIPASGQAIRIRATRLRRPPATGGRSLSGPYGDDGESVLVVKTLGAPPPPARRRRRARNSEPGAEPSSLPLTRATAVRAFAPFEGEEEAARWLDQATEAEETADVLVGEGVELLNRALHAQAVAAADPLRTAADAGAGESRCGRLRRRRGGRRRPLQRRPRGRRLGQRRLAPAPARRGPAPAGTGRGRCSAGASRSPSARCCCCAPAPTSTPGASARRRAAAAGRARGAAGRAAGQERGAGARRGHGDAAQPPRRGGRGGERRPPGRADQRPGRTRCASCWRSASGCCGVAAFSAAEPETHPQA